MGLGSYALVGVHPALAMRSVEGRQQPDALSEGSLRDHYGRHYVSHYASHYGMCGGG